MLMVSWRGQKHPKRELRIALGYLQAFYLQQQATHVRGATEHVPGSVKLHYYPNMLQHSAEKHKRLQEDQKQVDKDETERSGEGSAPNSGGNEASKDRNRNSNSREKLGSGSGNNGNGNSATKQCQGSNQPNNESGNNGNGNSATKAGNVGGGNGNSGNDASTTSKVCSFRPSNSGFESNQIPHLVRLCSSEKSAGRCSAALLMGTLTGSYFLMQEAAALRGTAEGGKRHVIADERAEVAEAIWPQAALEHALDIMRSRSTSLKLEHVPASGNGEGSRK